MNACKNFNKKKENAQLEIEHSVHCSSRLMMRSNRFNGIAYGYGFCNADSLHVAREYMPSLIFFFDENEKNNVDVYTTQAYRSYVGTRYIMHVIKA